MRVCFIVSEIFAYKRLGGYGKLARMLGSNLVKRGIDVCAVTWQDPGQGIVESVDGITVLSFPYNFKSGSLLSHVSSYAKAHPLYRVADSDIYHSIEASVETYIAEKAMPKRHHLVHFQDPYDETAFCEMASVDPVFTWNRKRELQFYSTLSVLRRACNGADQLSTQATCFIPTVKRLYNVNKKDVDFLPNPVEIPQRELKKADEPTVCFIGRWDPQKRVHLFLELAKKFPEVRFIAMGKGYDDVADSALRTKYHSLPNLEMTGFVTEEEKSRIIEQSWVMISTSIREGLPIAFLEALAHKTAILSYVNPDNFASRFGYHARNMDFEFGLQYLLKDDLWKKKGLAGHDYVSKVHDLNRVIDQYITVYKNLIG